MYSLHASTIYGETTYGTVDSPRGPSMAAIVGPGGPTMATKYAIDGPGGPILGGPPEGSDTLWNRVRDL